MPQTIGLVSLVVKDYDEAIDFYVNKLNFDLVEDTPLGDKRWVVVKPSGERGAALLLAKASDERQLSAVGSQTGGRVFLFLYTDNFAQDYENYLSNGVEFLEKPRHENYGTVAVFRDCYGNQWDLIERKN